MLRRNTLKINDLMRNYWKENPEIYHQMMEARVCRLWGELLGKTVMQYTSNTYIKNRVLFVSLTSSVVRSELIAIRKQLVIKLNENAGTNVIDEIVIR
ncbi:MAG: DUF721 domain-containing protein [Tannerella sp.]|jgi:hypothetical protein|nr:DUF721 domain-containing protein [Tannerella sp.]